MNIKEERIESESKTKVNVYKNKIEKNTTITKQKDKERN